MRGQALRKGTIDYPFIEKKSGVCGGSPVIQGTRTRVIDIAIEYETLGYSPDEIIDNHPHLNLSQIHEALSYYYQHRDELDKKMVEDQKFIERIKKSFPSKIRKIIAKN